MAPVVRLAVGLGTSTLLVVDAAVAAVDTTPPVMVVATDANEEAAASPREEEVDDWPSTVARPASAPKVLRAQTRILGQERARRRKRSSTRGAWARRAVRPGDGGQEKAVASADLPGEGSCAGDAVSEIRQSLSSAGLHSCRMSANTSESDEESASEDLGSGLREERRLQRQSHGRRNPDSPKPSVSEEQDTCHRQRRACGDGARATGFALDFDLSRHQGAPRVSSRRATRLDKCCITCVCPLQPCPPSHLPLFLLLQMRARPRQPAPPDPVRLAEPAA